MPNIVAKRLTQAQTPTVPPGRTFVFFNLDDGGLLYTKDEFATFTPVHSGGGVNEIGPAEDGDYDDGLFQDFDPSTPIGVPIDRYNELFLSLVPPGAPPLSDWSAVKAGTEVQGKLSFDTGNQIFGQSYIGADIAPINPISVDGLFVVSGKRLGISDVAGDVSGVLNDQIVVHGGTPTPAYQADMFGDAEKGDLKLFVNGVEVVTAAVNLTSSTGVIDSTTGSTQSGFSVSAQDPSKFPLGDDFNEFQNRTGTWLLTDDDPNLVQGYNYVEAIHIVIPATDERVVARFEFVIDDNVVVTAYSNQNMDTLLMAGSKKLSGVDYHTSGTSQYDVDVDNAYRNTYNPDADAVKFLSNSNGYGIICSAPAEALPNNAGNELLQHSVVDKLVTITPSGMRLIDEAMEITTEVKRTIQGTTQGGTDSITDILLDNVAATSTNFIEGFDDENKRLLSSSTYDLIGDVAANPWDSDQSLDDGSAGHIDGLQIIDGKLVYPAGNVSYPPDFRTTAILNGSVYNDGGVGGSARDYSALAGNRVYLRFFQQVAPTVANFTVNIAGSGGTFKAVSDTSGTDWIHVEIKGPTETGWMDAYADFATGQFADGDGARNATAGAGRAFGTTWGLTIGTKNTANTGGYMVMRITVPDTFTGELTNIAWTFG